MPPDTWTRLACTRDGKQVTLVQEILAGPDAGTVGGLTATSSEDVARAIMFSVVIGTP